MAFLDTTGLTYLISRLNQTFIKDVAINGRNITVTRGDGNTNTLVTKDTTYSNASSSEAGLMSKEDKDKLEHIEEGANNYTLPVASDTVLGGVKIGANLSISNGVLSATNTTYTNATDSKAGLMSTSDKIKLRDIEEGANKYVLPVAGSGSATSGTLGGVKIGANITLNNGLISLSKINVLNALEETLDSWSAIKGGANATDNKVTTTLDNSAKFYLAGTNSSTTTTGGLTFSTGVSVTGTGVTANTFTGNLIGTANAAKYADYAEFYPRGEETERGDVIALDVDAETEQYIKATEDSVCVVGVHSEDYGFIVGGDEVPEGEDIRAYNLPKFIPVGMVGRVPVKFIGKAKKGMKVTVSHIPGVATGFNGGCCGNIIGYLIEDDDKDQEVRLLKIKLR